MSDITVTGPRSLRATEDMLRHIEFRGIYDAHDKPIHPYKNARFSITTVYPQASPGGSPEIQIGRRREPLFTPQPTIYENQTKILEEVDAFLLENDLKMSALRGVVEYAWKGRGNFHILPPVVEKHTFFLKDGYLDLPRFLRRFKGLHVRDARGRLHALSNRYLRSFYIVCDGAHRLDLVLEKVKQPMNVLLVEHATSGKHLYPYYAFPVPFRPSLRLSSKLSEKMYHRLERDKIHLLNDFIKKTMHYDWDVGGLKVSTLRSNVDIF